MKFPQPVVFIATPTSLHRQAELAIGELVNAGAGAADWLALANRLSIIIKDQEEQLQQLRSVLDGTYA